MCICPFIVPTHISMVFKNNNWKINYPYFKRRLFYQSAALLHSKNCFNIIMILFFEQACCYSRLATLYLINYIIWIIIWRYNSGNDTKNKFNFWLHITHTKKIYMLPWMVCFVLGILARVTEGDKSDMEKQSYEYIRFVKLNLTVCFTEINFTFILLIFMITVTKLDKYKQWE